MTITKQDWDELYQLKKDMQELKKKFDKLDISLNESRIKLKKIKSYQQKIGDFMLSRLE